MIPKIIHYCWFGGNPLPDDAKKCIASWEKYFPDYEITEWNESNFDLAILALTDLPAIAHDSLILKNISDGSIDGIMKIYNQSEKQIFIAFDKQDSYGPQTTAAACNRSTFILSCCHNLLHSSIARIVATALHIQDAEEVRVLRSRVKHITSV
jgi:hypothetical protein